MDTEHLWDTTQFNHAPLRPPRDGVIGEQVFAEKWAKLMEDDGDIMKPPNVKLGRVLYSYGFNLGPREATVAASLVCWLGTNLGRAFLGLAEQVAKSTGWRRDAYLGAWAVQNLRQSYRNSGLRTLEYCLTPEENWKAGGRMGTSGPSAVPELSTKDLEVAEHLVMWLGDEEGQKFLRDCVEEIEQRCNTAALDHHLKHNLKLDDQAIKTVKRLAAECS